jgi:very-short-patch-repair endonuclease
MEVVDALRALGGTARWKQLRGHVGWRAVKRARADGEIRRDGDAYSIAGTDRDRVLAQQLRGVRTHVTAAAHHGFALPRHDHGTVHITVPRKARRKEVPGDVRLHYRDHEPEATDGDVTSALQTVIDCLRDEPFRVALCVGDSALASEKVSAAELAARAAALRGPGAARVRHRVALLDGRAANAFESSCRAILIEAGILGFEPQVSIRHAGHWVGRVDLAHRVLRVVVECDGFQTHGGRDAFVRDLVRFTLLVSAGWRPLRFTWEQVMFGPDWVLERVRDTIELGAAPNGASKTAQRPAAVAAPAAGRRPGGVVPS